MAFPYQGVLFDWAFTLVDLVDEDQRPAFERMLDFMRSRGMDTPPLDEAFRETQEVFYEMIAASRVTHREACFEHVLRYFLCAYDIKFAGKTTVEELLRVYYEAIHAPRKLYPDTLAALEQLQSMGVRMGVISNTTNPGFIKQEERKRLGLDGFFEFCVYSSEVPYRKPHPSIFRIALRRWGIQPSAILFVGDDLKYDVRGAQSVGMRAAWLNRGNRSRPEEIRPDHEIGTLVEIPAITV